MSFSPQLRSHLQNHLGHAAANELEAAITLTSGAVASQADYQQQAAKMVELADRLDKLTIRMEHIERNAAADTAPVIQEPKK